MRQKRDADIVGYYALVYVDTRTHTDKAVGRRLRASGWGKAKGRSPVPWEVWGLRPAWPNGPVGTEGGSPDPTIAYLI